MKRYYTAEQMRAADSYTIKVLGVSSSTLMERAGRAIAEEAERVAAKKGADSICVVCGTGNNGGDGYVCARLLSAKGYNVTVVALEGRLSFDCQRERSLYKGKYSYEVCGDIVIDCIFGTGLARAVEGEAARLVAAICASGAYVISADIPSGLSSDSGKVLGVAVRADVTVAIGGLKLGYVLSDGPDMCGSVILADIGISTENFSFTEEFESKEIAALFPARPRNSHKGTFGRAVLVCGSEKYPGAALLSVSAALRSGCGFVEAVTAEKVKYLIASRCPQAVFAPSPTLSGGCIAVGMGCGVSEELYKLISELLSDYCGTLIIDADGLNALAQFGVQVLKNKKCRVILTPHVKEFSRISALTTEQILADPLGACNKFAREYGVTIVLKGVGSVICDGARAAVNTRGSTAQAKAGSGDLLSGFMCGCIARGLSPFEGAVCANYVMGAAAELAAERCTEWCATAEDIVSELPFAVKNIISGNE